MSLNFELGKTKAYIGGISPWSKCPCLSAEQFYAVAMTRISSEVDRVDMGGR